MEVNRPIESRGRTFRYRILRQSDIVRFRDYIYNGTTVCLNRKFRRFYQ